MRAIIKTGRDAPAALDPGPPPMLDWIKIDRLVIDDNYQRELRPGNWKAIRNIASKFKWSRFSPVFVAPIEGGLYAIIDGQHRTHAAAICGFEAVPCQIVQMSRSEQAESFAAVNGMVTKVTTWNLFKAALSGGEGWAVEARKVADDAGCRLMTSNSSMANKLPGNIFGPTTFRQIISDRGPKLVTQALRLLKSAEGYGDNHDSWDMHVLAPILRAMTAVPALFDRDDAKAIIERFDHWKVIDAIGVETKRKLRLGLPCPSRKDQLETALQSFLERKIGDDR